MAIFDNGMAPSTQSAMVQTANVPRSSFNYSRVTNFNGVIGAIMPFDVMATLPNEDYTISYDTLAITRNPLVRRLQNGMKIYIHTYWMPCRDLWKGWDNFIDKGRSGTHVSEIPKLYPCLKLEKTTVPTTIDAETDDYTTFVPLAPSSYMGVPIVAYDNTIVNKNYAYTPVKVTATTKVNENRATQVNGTKWGINALPFVMYNKIYADYYMNKDLVQSGATEWVEENVDDELILPYVATHPNNQGYVIWSNSANLNNNVYKWNNSYKADFLNGESAVYVPKKGSNSYSPLLNMLHFRQFKGDYFTSANPFVDLIRGNSANATLDFQTDASLLDSGTNVGDALLISTSGLATNPLITNRIQTVFEKIKIKGTLNALRKALVLEKFMQRNATTDGTYRSLIGAQFGYYPNVHDRKPRYIGGCYQDINFTEVVQTSSGGTGAGEMLGKTTSRGMSASSGYIGKFHSDDYGYIMSVMTIVPDVYYNQQGLDTMWTKTRQDEQYYPILNNLEPQPIKNKEIFISGSQSTDEGVFGYTNRFEDLKSRRNIICGFGATGNKSMWDSYNFMKRTFTTTPTLSMASLTMSPSNIDLTPFSSVNEVPFDIVVGCNVDKVSPMPFKAEPTDMGIKY